MILLIDNYDSFTYNLYQYLCELGADVRVVRNDETTLDEIERMAPEKIVVSPGPSTPEKAGISNDVIRRFGERTPTLGVCLGHQCIGYAYGGTVGAPGRSCTARLLWCTTTARGSSRGCRTRSRRSGTTRWPCTRRTCPPTWT